MKFTQLAALAALGALTAGMWQYSQATAETPDSQEQFIAAARAAGYTQTDNQLLRDGFLVCASQSQEGVNDDLVLRGIEVAQRWLGGVPDEARDQVFIDLAERWLCPAESDAP